MQTSLPWDHFLMQPALAALYAFQENAFHSKYHSRAAKRPFLVFPHTCWHAASEKTKKCLCVRLYSGVWDAFGCGQRREQCARPFGVSSGEFPRVTRLCPPTFALCAAGGASCTCARALGDALTMMHLGSLAGCKCKSGHTQLENPHGKSFSARTLHRAAQTSQIGFTPFLFGIPPASPLMDFSWCSEGLLMFVVRLAGCESACFSFTFLRLATVPDTFGDKGLNFIRHNNPL